ncbi:thiamine-phosphate kinase [bacterium]|nr:thiamine-phosphate kinase [bacterium]
MIRLKDLGEINLIERFRNNISYPHSKIILGIGDDAAVVKNRANKYLVATTDFFIEDVHFDLKFSTFYQIGWKATAVNLSDIAAMGATPKYLLLSVGLPEDLAISSWDEICKGILDLSSKFKVHIIGGDMVKSHKLLINITLLGEVAKDGYVSRRGIKRGEKLAVTGCLGDSKAGLNILKNQLDINKKEREILINKHLFPYPKIKEGLIISKYKVASSMMDISDGLSSELYRLAQENEVGFKLYEEKIPCSPALLAFSQKTQGNPVEMALSGGEDYELLFTCQEERLKILQKAKINYFIIGEVLPEKEIIILKKGGFIEKVERSGYEHFKDIH